MRTKDYNAFKLELSPQADAVKQAIHEYRALKCKPSSCSATSAQADLNRSVHQFHHMFALSALSSSMQA
jgi:hypothetical protein